MNEILRKRLDDFHKEVEAAGEELRDVPLPVLTEETFGLYEKNGNRLIYEGLYFPRRKQLATFGLLSIWHKKAEDLKKLQEIITEICGERCWALPAHVDRKEKDWDITVDLFASETAQTLAEITAQLGDLLPETIHQMVKREVDRRIFDSYLSKPFGQWKWEHYMNNWVAVCAGSIGSAAMYLLNDHPEKQNKIIDRVIETMPCYLEGMMDDGTCPEGMSYFTYGMAYFAGFAEQLYRFTNHKVNLMADPKVERIARFQQTCYFDSGLTVSFSDGSCRDKFRLGLTCYLASLYPGIRIPQIDSVMKYTDDSCYRFMANYRDDIWVKTYGEHVSLKGEGEASMTVLPSAQWAMGRGDNGTGFAAKGGHNDEPHNHNDVGSFLYLAGKDMFLTDLGCGEYTKDYFGEKRYEILNNRSKGHNVPLIDGKEQLPGTSYRASLFKGDFQGEEGEVTISFGDAYPQGLLKEAVRRLVFRKKDGALNIKDSFLLDQGKEVTENLVTQYEPFIENKKVTLLGKDGKLTIFVPDGEDITAKKEEFPNHKGKTECLYRITWTVKAVNKLAESRFDIRWEKV